MFLFYNIGYFICGECCFYIIQLQHHLHARPVLTWNWTLKIRISLILQDGILDHIWHVPLIQESGSLHCTVGGGPPRSKSTAHSSPLSETNKHRSWNLAQFQIVDLWTQSWKVALIHSKSQAVLRLEINRKFLFRKITKRADLDNVGTLTRLW